MTELDKIRVGLAQNGRKAYQAAKKNNSAYILHGKSIYKVSANGKKEVVTTLAKTKVLVKKKEFSI